MWSILASLIGGPIVNALVSGYKAKLSAQGQHDSLKAEIAQRELSIQKVEAKATAKLKKAELGYWYEPDKLMGYTVAVYFAKIVIWDKVLAYGTTDPLAGWAATTAGLIVSYYFAKRGIENVVRIWKG